MVPGDEKGSMIANPWENSLQFMEDLQTQHQETLDKITAGFSSNLDLWSDTQHKLSHLWLENFENLSLALFQSNSAPKLDALMGFDTKIKDFAIASTKLSICASELQVLFIKIWSQAHENFVVENSDPSETPKDAINTWLEKANSVVLKFQQSDDYLDAKKRYATSLSDFQSAYKELIKVYQENNHMPTQEEFDDLSKTVYLLKKELRTIKKQIAKDDGANNE